MRSTSQAGFLGRGMKLFVIVEGSGASAGFQILDQAAMTASQGSGIVAEPPPTSPI